MNMYATTEEHTVSPAMENSLDYQRQLALDWRREAIAQHEAMLYWSRSHSDLLFAIENQPEEPPIEPPQIESESVPLPVIKSRTWTRPFRGAAKASIWVWKIGRMTL